MIGVVSFWGVTDLIFFIEQVNYNHSLIYQVLNLVPQCPTIFDFLSRYIHVIETMNIWIKPFWDACPQVGLNSNNEFVFHEPCTHGRRSFGTGVKARFSFSAFFEYPFDSRRVLAGKTMGT